MRDQLIQYVKLLFAGLPEREEMQQEILQNTLDRYDDLISQGKSPEAAYRLAIGGIGDINEILGSQPSPAPAAIPEKSSPTDIIAANRKKWMQAVAIGLYICCVLPVIILGNVGDGILGVCLMFLMIAAATVLLILAPEKKEEEDEAKRHDSTQGTPRQKAILKALNTTALVVFLVVSFATGAWHITWLIFPMMAAVKGIFRAAWDIMEADEE